MSKNAYKISKRKQLEKANSTVFVAVAIAAVIVMFSLISTRFMWNKKSYNDRVITAKTKARNDIKQNVENLGKLAEQFPALDNSATLNATTILHALPPLYDYASLATSLNAIAITSGVTFNGSSGQDTSADAIKSAPVSKPIEIPITLQVTGSYDAIKTYMTNLERSIRPIQVSNVSYSGSSDQLQAQIQAITYYQPARSFDVTKMEVQ